MEREERIVVGVNRFQVADEPPPDLQRVDPAIERIQRERVAKIKAQRDQALVAARLQALEDAARSDANLLPPILDAVRVYASVGEICDRLRGVFGKYKPPATL